MLRNVIANRVKQIKITTVNEIHVRRNNQRAYSERF